MFLLSAYIMENHYIGLSHYGYRLHLKECKGAL